jgi:5'-3' exonuclease
MSNDQGPALFVDARNALYRAIYASKADTRHQVRYHYFTILLRQIVGWINQVQPSSVHIFWDTPRNKVWRRSALATYKDRSASTYVEDISEELKSTTDIATEFFKVMNVRQYLSKGMEADDMIYAATTVMHPYPSIIVSTDSDMIQIPFSYDSSRVYNPTKKAFTEIPDVSPVWQKALCGDKADHINGYHGIGPKKSEKLLESHEDLRKFLKDKGPAIFYRNLLLIDLSLCPRLLKNQVTVQRRLSEQTCYDKAEINRLILKHKVQGLMQEFANLVQPFKNMS